MVVLGLSSSVLVALAVVAAFAVGLLAWSAFGLWRNVKALTASLSEARDRVQDALEEVDAEVRRAAEGLERITGPREAAPAPDERGY